MEFDCMVCEHKYKELIDKKVCGKCNQVIWKTEVYSRVVGYIRPVSNWNDSKQAEFHDRKLFEGAVKNV